MERKYGYAFIEYDNKNSARAAVEELDNTRMFTDYG